MNKYSVRLEYVGFAFGVADLCLILNTTVGSGFGAAIMGLREIVDSQMEELKTGTVCRTISVITASSSMINQDKALGLQEKVWQMIDHTRSIATGSPNLARTVIEYLFQVEWLAARISDIAVDMRGIGLHNTTMKQMSINLELKSGELMKEVNHELVDLLARDASTDAGGL